MFFDPADWICHQALVVNVEPDVSVVTSMNEINRQRRLRALELTVNLGVSGHTVFIPFHDIHNTSLFNTTIFHLAKCLKEVFFELPWLNRNVIFPECVARVPVSLGGLGVRLCSPSFAFAFASVRNRLR